MKYCVRSSGTAKCLVFGLLLVASLGARADHDFRVSGYGTLGLSYEGEEDLGFFRENTQNKRPDQDWSLKPDSQLGVQLSYSFESRFHATAQFVLADKPDYDLDAITEWAFVGYTPAPGLDLRAGRVAADLFRLSEVRRIDYASLWVRPPSELYGWIIPYALDGADIAKSFAIGPAFLRAKLQYGATNPKIQSPDGEQEFQTEFNDLFVVSLTGEYDFWSARLSYAQFSTATVEGRTRELFDAIQAIGQIPGPIGNDARHLYHRLSHTSNADVEYYQLGLGYDDGALVFDAEIARLTSMSCVLPTGNAGYVSLGYRINAFTPYVVYSGFDPDKEIITSSADWSALPQGEVVKGVALDILNNSFVNQYTTSLGVRWDFGDRLALKGQWDRSTVEADSYGLWAYDNDREERGSTVDVLSLSLNFIF
ncbi:hypothetical protein [Marinobacter sp. F4216]|uniref:hypothetical protein n=1 Tax=Marinobacter sp. F4216 TaxID=2874281 RepID=UPI001CC09FD6|nr:hypothetical protein [Marinobacter sp. F4216]MBZ2168077.1 hypothetical protein [Marinobacter sp. F4216]